MTIWHSREIMRSTCLGETKNASPNLKLFFGGEFFSDVCHLTTAVGAAKSTGTVWKDGFTAFWAVRGGVRLERKLCVVAAFITRSATMTGKTHIVKVKFVMYYSRTQEGRNE